MKLLRALMIMTLPGAALLTGCGDGADDSAKTGGLTADDVQQLNDAAAMLDITDRPPLPSNTQAP